MNNHIRDQIAAVLFDELGDDLTAHELADRIIADVDWAEVDR